MFRSKIDPKVRHKLDEIGVDDVRARLEAINRVRDLGQEDAQDLGDGISASRADLRRWLDEKAVRDERSEKLRWGVGIGISLLILFLAFKNLHYNQLNYDNLNRPRLSVADLSFTLRDNTPTLMQALNENKVIPILWRIKNAGNEDAIQIKIKLILLYPTTKFHKYFHELSWMRLPSAVDTGDQWIGATLEASDFVDYFAFCYQYSSDRGQVFKEADYAKLSKPDDNARTLAIFPALRATADYDQLRQVSPCYR